MLESFGAEFNYSLNPFANSSQTGILGNLEPIAGMIAPAAFKNLAMGCRSHELIDATLAVPKMKDNLMVGKNSFGSQIKDTSKNVDKSVDSLTGIVLSQGTDSSEVTPILQQALQSARDSLTGLATDPNYNSKMNLAFGENFDPKVANDLVQKLAKGDFTELPAIKILSSASINGANGAFAKATNTIYLSSEFINKNAGNAETIASVILEETGHYIDSQINTKDADGDEGDIFARVVQGKTISAGELLELKAEDDTAIVTFDSQAIQIEQAKKIGSDRVIDLIRQEKGSWVNGINDAEIFQSKGDWTFNKRIQLPDMGAMNGDFVNLIAGDFDGNGISDFIRQEKGDWVNGINDAQVYLGAGNGTFKSPIQMTDMGAMNGNFVNLIAGDFNGDKYTDIIRQEKGSWVNGIRDVEIYLSNGNGTFKNPILMNNADVMNGNVVNLIVGDFTGGGADDIIRQEKGNWVNGINDVEFRTFSNGNFIKVKDVPDMEAMNGDFVNLVAGDFNGDRVTDLIRQEKGSRIDGVRDAEIYISNGNWGFKSRTVMNNASAMNGDNVTLIVGDLTGGGADDIVRQEKGGWVDNVNDIEFLTYSNGNFVKVKDAPNMSDLNGNYVTLVPGLFGSSSNNPPPPNPGGGNPDIDIQLYYPNGGFTGSQMNQIEKAAQNWERIITKDKDSSGILKISIVKENLNSYFLADAIIDTARNYRNNFNDTRVDINGVDYHNNIRFNTQRFSHVLNNNLLVRLAMHEIGHTLGLDHEAGISLMNHWNFNPQMTDSMYSTLSAQGYNVDRNVPIYWS
jgi:hypothetical protein